MITWAHLLPRLKILNHAPEYLKFWSIFSIFRLVLMFRIRKTVLIMLVFPICKHLSHLPIPGMVSWDLSIRDLKHGDYIFSSESSIFIQYPWQWYLFFLFKIIWIVFLTREAWQLLISIQGKNFEVDFFLSLYETFHQSKREMFVIWIKISKSCSAVFF